MGGLGGLGGGRGSTPWGRRPSARRVTHTPRSIQPPGGLRTLVHGRWLTVGTELPADGDQGTPTRQSTAAVVRWCFDKDRQLQHFFQKKKGGAGGGGPTGR